MWVEALIVAALAVGIFVWLVDGFPARARGPRRRSVEVALRRAARALDGEVLTPRRGAAELHFDVDGAPAVVRAESDYAVLRIDLSCLRKLEQLCASWNAGTLEGSRALMAHRYAPLRITVSRQTRQLCLQIGRIATAPRIVGCAEFARRLVPLLVRASLERHKTAYR